MLWIGTENGICQYNYSTQSFTKIQLSHNNKPIDTPYVNDISQDNDGNLWFVINHKAFQLIPNTHQLKKVNTETQYSKIYFDSKNQGWLGTRTGEIRKLNKKDFTTQSVLQHRFIQNVNTIKAKGNNLWVGYQDGGVCLYNTQGKLKKHYKYKSDKWNIERASVRDIEIDKSGRIWLATFKGLFIEKDGQLKRYSPENAPGLPHTSIFCIYPDEENGMWVGTWTGGIAYYHQKDNHFQNYQFSNNKGSISNNIVSSFAQTENDKVYVGTEVGGLNIYHLENNKFSQVELRTNDQLAYNVKALATDKYNRLWIGTLQGLFCKDGKKIEHYSQGPNDGKHISSKNIYSLCAADSGIWVGTFGGSINFYSFKHKRFWHSEQLFKEPVNRSIRCLSLDQQNNLWFGTHDGIYRYKDQKLTHFTSQNTSLPSNTYYCIYPTKDGKIWFGSRSHGVVVFDPSKQQFHTETLNDKIKDLDVYGIISDKKDNIWLTSNNGIFCINKHPENIHHFTHQVGIQSNLFNPLAIFKDTNNTLYFGGTNGLTTFQPDELKRNQRAPRAMINKITINNKTQVNYFNLIKKDTKAELDLQYFETSLRFDFSADNYLLPSKNRFQYRLIGLSKEWINSESEANAIFTNLSDGDYIFEVKAANNDGIWNETPTQIFIHIDQPFWQSPLAYLIYISILAGIMWLFIRFNRDKQHLKKQVLLEKLERQKKDELHEMKLQFFTNISHEFRTPLTLIAGPIKQLLTDSQLSVKSQEYLEVVDRNSKRLLGLVNQILDLRKAENTKSTLQVGTISLKPFIEERYLNFKQLATDQQIDYQFIFHGENDIYIEADEDKLDKIIYNLLSNAFKNTAAHGSISIEAGLYDRNRPKKNYSNQLKFGQLDADEAIEISVIDTGKGIASNDLLKIFNRFEQTSDTPQGTGIGLSLCHEFTLLHRGDITAQSTPKKGSRFNVRLPRKQAAQKMLSNKAMHPEQTPDFPINETSPVMDGNRPLILIVEDQTDLRKYLTDLLSQKYDTLQATNGKQALKLLNNHAVNIILSDVMMPEMDGFELCQQVKSNIETSHIPVILLTALSSIEQKVVGFRKGADAYIPKPFDEDHLFTRIENLILQRDRLKQSFNQKVIKEETLNVGDLDHYFLNRLNKIIEENIQNEEFSVELLASNAGISRSQLHRKLKSLTGSSTTEYMRMIRLKKAAEHLKRNEYNIDEIAYLVGFTSHSYFSKCFKQLYQVSPKEYKAKYMSHNQQ
jgi:signal transduction histidine kinase/ligand-binding sensor domain-containing protein/DNA-binding response OmpR family regulator